MPLKEDRKTCKTQASDFGQRGSVVSAFRAKESCDVTASAKAIRALGKRCVHDVLLECERKGTIAIQPRSGVGDHLAMLNLLRQIEDEAAPEIATVTIDSYTRLRKFEQAGRILRERPEQLNGYPLVSHGAERGAELNSAIRSPLDIRHGSPIAEELFETALAAGITSFEGGGITYNVPYCKDVSLATSLDSWQRIDSLCGELARNGVIVAREIFGTLTAVLVPPSLALAISFLEAMSAAEQGVRCLLIAYPQGGNISQDVAALHAIEDLAKRYLPAEVHCFPVLHQYMGPFPSCTYDSYAIIAYGALVAKAGRARKVVVKTAEESRGIPSAKCNIEAIKMVRAMIESPCEILSILSHAISEETEQIVTESREIIEGVLDRATMTASICSAFEKGHLDVPFSPSRHVAGRVIPAREPNGAIRYFDSGTLPFSPQTVSFNKRKLNMPLVDYGILTKSVNYFIQKKRFNNDFEYCNYVSR